MERTVYLARVKQSNDGWYAIDFPDLPGTHAQSRTLDGAQKEAEDSLCCYLLAAESVGEKIHAPSVTIALKSGETLLCVTANNVTKRM